MAKRRHRSDRAPGRGGGLVGAYELEYLLAAGIDEDADAFDIVMAAIENPAPAPFTRNPDWIAQAITPAVWLEPMGFDSSLLTWQEFTRLTYEEVFPNQSPANAYFLNYHVTLSGEIVFAANALKQGELMAGFNAYGQPASKFLVMGPEDASVPVALEDLQSFMGQAIIVPEPSTYLMAAMGIVALLFSRRRNLHF